MFRIRHHFEKRGLICKPRAVCLRRGEGAGRGAVHGWIVIYPVDSAIQRLNNWGLEDKKVLECY